MSTSSRDEQAVTLDPRTTMGTVRLTVSDLGRSTAFYEQALGLRVTELENGAVALGEPGGAALVELTGDGSAARLDRRATGLFHLAVLVPTRRDLAFALARLIATRWPLDGASDHLVSEALYLSDPDGNGIEIYRDRPREQWSFTDVGALEMATLPLDLNNVADELSSVDSLQGQVAAGTRIGHTHLQVAELADVERFYAGVLGFDVVVRGYPGALFVSAGGYHHHVGLNTWNSRGSEPPVPGAVGLRSFEVQLPDDAALEAVLRRVADAGLPTETVPERDSHLVRDPSGNAVELRVA